MSDLNWISVGQAAQELGMSYPRAARAIYEGHLDAVMVGGRWRVDPNSVERLKRLLGNARGNLELGAPDRD
jgi:excisionase family DNA binding protein